MKESYGKGYGTAVDHVLAMGFDDPWMDDDLRQVLRGHEVVLDEEPLDRVEPFTCDFVAPCHDDRPAQMIAAQADALGPTEGRNKH